LPKFALILSTFAALASAATAAAAGPTLSVAGTTSEYSIAGSTIIRFEDTGREPVGSIDVFAPPAYELSLDQPIGATLGTLDAHVRTAATSDLHVAGLIKNADPAAYVTTAAACTPDRALHDAAWTANLNSGGTTIGRVVLFIDHGGADYSARIRTCLDEPTTSGYRLLRATLTLNGLFSNPAAAGEYRWTTIMRTLAQTPMVPFQSQTIVTLPPRLTIAAMLIRPHGRRGRTFIRVSGNVTTGVRGVSGVRVEVLAGRNAAALRRLTYATSFERGRYEVVAPLSGNTLFRARISAPLRAGPLSRCERFKLQPDAVCSSLTLAPFTAQSRTLRLN
jgi:hypothetical protein